jgi:uncharacterized membrane protein
LGLDSAASELEERYKSLFLRIGYAGLGIVFIALALTIWGQAGYIYIQDIFAESFLLLVGAYYSLLAVTNQSLERKGVLLVLGPALFSVAIVLIYLLMASPSFGTDELAIEYYSAFAFLHGANPYLPQAVSGVFSAFHVPEYYVTPLTTGGNIVSLGYPALSFLVLVPFSAINIQRPALLLVIFEFALFVFFMIYYHRQKLDFLLPLVLFTLLAYTEYVFFAAGGVTDILWVVFALVGTSFLFEKKPAMAGIFLGLAISSKQTPFFLFPFLIWYVYKEGLSLRKFVLPALGTFFLLNGYFLITQPVAWLNGVLSPETSPLVGIGAGLSQLSFTGIYFLPSWFFTTSLVVIFLACLALYILRYDSLKWAFFVFPAIVLLLNFRVLDNYLMYWPLFGLLVVPQLSLIDSRAEKVTRVRQQSTGGRNWVLFSVVMLCTSLVLGGMVVHDVTQQGIGVNSVYGLSDPSQVPNYVTGMNVTVTYEGSAPSIPVFFRIFTNSSITNANGLLWTALGDNSIASGTTKTFQIVPLTSVDFLPVYSEFDLVAYSGQYQGSMVTVEENNFTVMVSNPGFSYFDSSSQSFPGWYAVQDGNWSEISPTFDPMGVTLNVEPHIAGGWSTTELGQSINLGVLATNNLTLQYRIAVGNGFVSEVAPSGWPVQMVGVQVDFNGAQQQIWFGYAASAATRIYVPSADLVVVLSNKTSVSFPYVLEIAKEMHWNPNGVQLNIIIASQIPQSPVSATFSNLNITR